MTWLKHTKKKDSLQQHLQKEQDYKCAIKSQRFYIILHVSVLRTSSLSPLNYWRKTDTNGMFLNSLELLVFPSIWSFYFFIKCYTRHISLYIIESFISWQSFIVKFLEPLRIYERFAWNKLCNSIAKFPLPTHSLIEYFIQISEWKQNC